jgi:hypothetical protein
VSAAVATCIETGTLMTYDTAEYLREATEEETIESIRTARRDGGAGVIVVGGKRCYVEGGEVQS